MRIKLNLGIKVLSVPVNEEDKADIIYSYHIKARIAYSFSIIWFVISNGWLLLQWLTTGYAMTFGLFINDYSNLKYDIFELIFTCIALGVLPSLIGVLLGNHWTDLKKKYFLIFFPK